MFLIQSIFEYVHHNRPDTLEEFSNKIPNQFYNMVLCIYFNVLKEEVI